MLSTDPVIVPPALLDRAAGRPVARTLIVGAHTPVAMESAKSSTDLGIIEPVLIGPMAEMEAQAEKMGWDTSGFQRIDAVGEDGIADAATVAVADESVQIVMKGQIHTDTLIKAMLKKAANVRRATRMTHVFHMGLPGYEKPLLLTDAVLNVAPNVSALKAILTNVVRVGHACGVDRPKIAVLSATEEPIPSMPTSIQAAELADWGNEQGWEAEIDGPFALDNALSPEAVKIKGMTGRPVAGQADAILVPNIECGNAMFKMLVYFRSACASGVIVGGRVPIIITSRADPPAARIGSAALATLCSGF
ncbi:MAG: phosphate acyltransferase [Pseudomonadota bacterium]